MSKRITDKKRLEWLETQFVEKGWGCGDTDDRVGAVWTIMGTWWDYEVFDDEPITLRQAIDKEIKKL